MGPRATQVTGESDCSSAARELEGSGKCVAGGRLAGAELVQHAAVLAPRRGGCRQRRPDTHRNTRFGPAWRAAGGPARRPRRGTSRHPKSAPPRAPGSEPAPEARGRARRRAPCPYPRSPDPSRLVGEGRRACRRAGGRVVRRRSRCCGTCFLSFQLGQGTTTARDRSPLGFPLPQKLTVAPIIPLIPGIG